MSLVGNSAVVLNELRDVRSQVEAMMTLKFEMEKRTEHQSQEMMQMKQVMATVVRASTARVHKLPPWYLTPNEVRFQPMALRNERRGQMFPC